MINIDYPFHFDSRGHTALADTNKHIQDMIEQLLLTNPGERVNRPDFGSGIQQLIFAPTSPEVASALQFTLKAAIQNWLGDLVQVQALEVTSVESTLNILIQYIVRSTNQQQQTTFSRAL